MKTSRNGLLFIARREAGVLVPYPDGWNKQANRKLFSQGIGHSDADLTADSPPITIPEMFARFKQDVAERDLVLGRRIKVPVEQHQWDALASLHFQSGNRYVWEIVALINDGKWDEAGQTFLLCDANLAGERKKGLAKRRIAEHILFNTGEYGELSPIPFWRGDPRTTKREEYIVQEGDL